MIEKRDQLFNFERLGLYQKAMDCIDFTYELTELFPNHELYGLSSQFRRTASSIALNKSEGAGSTSDDFNIFIRISKSSIRECIVGMSISIKGKYISAVDEAESRRRLFELTKMNSGLSNSIKIKRTFAFH